MFPRAALKQIELTAEGGGTQGWGQVIMDYFLFNVNAVMKYIRNMYFSTFTLQFILCIGTKFNQVVSNKFPSYIGLT